MKLKSSKTRFKGTAVVEAAIVLPLLLLLTLGVIQYSWLFLKAQQITNAARSGARIGVVGGDIGATVDTLMAAAGIDTSVYSVGYTDPNSVSSGAPVTVTITWDATKIALINAPNLLPVPKMPLLTSVTMAMEGP